MHLLIDHNAPTLANLRVGTDCPDHDGRPHKGTCSHAPCHEHKPHLGDMVPAAAVIRRTVHHLHQALAALATAAVPHNRHQHLQPLHQQLRHQHYASSDKIRRDLVGLVQLAHRLLAKLAACLSWAQQASSAFILSQSLWAHVQHVDVALKQSLDKLRHLNLLIAAAKHANRNPDVPTAAVVLSTGSYPFLPLPTPIVNLALDARHHFAQQFGQPEAQHDVVDNKDTDPEPDPLLMDHLNDAIRSRMLLHECAIPPVFMAHHHIDRGLVSFSVPNEFAVTLSLPGGFDSTIPWSLVAVDVLDPSIFQHLDESRRSHVQQHLMKLCAKKLSDCPSTNQATPRPGRDEPRPPPSTKVAPPNQPSIFEIPLVDLYHMLHHIFLSMRLEALYFQAGTRDRSSGVLAAISDPEFDAASQSMCIRFWLGTFNAQSIIFSTTRTAQELLFNASQHLSLCPVPPVSIVPTLCTVGAKKVTSSALHVQSTNLILQFGPLRLSIPPRISLESLVTWCMCDYARESLLSLHDRLAEQKVSSRLFLGSDTDNHDQGSALVTPNRLAGDHIVLPDHGLAIAIHQTTGQFSVVPLDRFHTDLKHVLDMLNKAPMALPEILHALTMSQRLGNLEASLSFDGLEPCPQDTPLTPNNRIVIDGMDLGPIRLARVLQLPYDPEYRLYLSMEAFPTTNAFIVRWGTEERRIIHEFSYGPDVHIVDLLRYFALVDRVNQSLLKHGFPVSWNGAWLKIDPSAILLRPAVQLMVSFMSVTVHVNSRLPLTLTILFSRSIPGLSSTLLTKSCASISELISYTFNCFGLVSLFAFLPTQSPSMCCSNFDSCTIELNLPTGDSVTLQPTDPLVIKTPSSTTLPGVRFPPCKSDNQHIGAVLSLLEQADNSLFQLHIGHLIPLLTMWSKISHIESAVASTNGLTATAGDIPRVIIKTVTTGAILFGPNAKLHISISPKEQVAVFRGEGWCPLPEVSAQLIGEDQAKAAKYLRLVDAGELTSLVCSGKLLDACMAVIAQAFDHDRLYLGGLDAVQEAAANVSRSKGEGAAAGGHKQGLTGEASSLPVKHVKVAQRRLMFVWASILFELSVTNAKCSKIDSSHSRRNGSNPESWLQPQQQFTVATMLTQSWRHALESAASRTEGSVTHEGQAYFDKLLSGLIKFLSLPQGILRCIARAVEGLPAPSFPLLLSPPTPMLPPSIAKAIPEHPEACLVVQGPKSPQGRDMSVSMVFAIPSPRVASGHEYVPLVYSWSGSVVSPWESKDRFDGGDDDDMIMNPSAVLAMLGMGDSGSGQDGAGDSGAVTNGSGSSHELKPTVQELLAEIKGESITQSTSEDSLLWSLTRLIQRWRGCAGASAGVK